MGVVIDWLFYADKPRGPTTGEVNKKLTYRTAVWWSKAHIIAWDWGDGIITNGMGMVEASHKYLKPGVYKVRAQEWCPIFGSAFTSSWSKPLIVVIA